MVKKSRKAKKTEDINEIAFRVVQESTSKDRFAKIRVNKPKLPIKDKTTDSKD